MVRVMGIIRKLLDQGEKVVNKFVVHLGQVVEPESLHTRHLVHELQKKPVQTRILLLVALTIDKLQQPGKAGLVHHAREHRIILATVKQKQTDYGMQRPCLVFLQQTIDDLGANVVLVFMEQTAGEKHTRASDDFILGFVVILAETGRQIYPGTQGIVDRFVGIAFARDACIEIYGNQSIRVHSWKQLSTASDLPVQSCPPSSS